MTATTRREFFTRLLRPALRPSPQPTPSMPTTASVTTSSDPLRLPPLQQTILDVATTNALFRDLAACTRILTVVPKYARNSHTGADTLTLDQARTRLAAELLLGVQIRYYYEGHTWCDTLIRRPQGLTLVRIRESDIAATLESSPAA